MAGVVRPAPAGARASAARKPRAAAYAFFWLIFAAILVAAHFRYLALPYFWDELGQFVPAALDILRHGAWVPQSTVPNVHPPGVMAYLAAVWAAFGYSITATRVAMLLVASLGVLATFLLAIRLCEGRPGAPAFIAAVLLLCDPLFYTQSMMAQLDMPAMAFGILGLLLFLRERYAWSAVACTAAVLCKETSLVLPLVLAGALLIENRRDRRALYFAAPCAAVAIWIGVLWHATGHPFGDAGFTHYNVAYALNPAHSVVSLVRHLYYLFIEDFRWLGLAAILIAWRRKHMFGNRAWRMTIAYFAAQTVFVSVLGGAELERYLVPVLPILYVAIAASWTALKGFGRNLMVATLCVGLVSGMFINPPFPFPYENNLAMADFVELQRNAGQLLEQTFPQARIYTAWPLTAALRRPEFGYVDRPLRMFETGDLHASTLGKLNPSDVDVLVLYSRTWEPDWGVLSIPQVRAFLTRFYDYEPQMTAEQARAELGLTPLVRWTERGQWLEIYARRPMLR